MQLRILLRRTMKNFHFWACFLCFVTILHAEGPEKSSCLEREKALALLETAEDFLSKAEDSYPSCKEDLSSTNNSECSGKKPLAFIQISKKLISDVRVNFPTCTEPKVQYVKHRDCSEILASGRNKSGVYTIWPSESNTDGKKLQVYCDMETSGGGWTVVQRRGKYPVQQDFYQDWEHYKNGFGNIKEEFWLGNDNIRVLCHKLCEIRFDLQNKDGKKGFALYKNFKLLGNNFTLYINDYTGDVGDSMKNHNNYVFSTKDKGNSKKAKELQGGWWYTDDIYSHLNGIYQPGKGGYEGIVWWTWRNSPENLAGVEIKVRPK